MTKIADHSPQPTETINDPETDHVKLKNLPKPEPKWTPTS
jgi:hypothetical protein